MACNVFAFSHFITEYVNTSDEASLFMCVFVSQQFVAKPLVWLKKNFTHIILAKI